MRWEYRLVPPSKLGDGEFAFLAVRRSLSMDRALTLANSIQCDSCRHQ